jgi:hypothetical protein
MKKIFFLAFLLVASVFTFAQEKSIDKTFNNVKSIKLTTASGDIILKKGSGSAVKLTIKYTYNESEFTPEISENGGRLTLKEELTRGNHSGNSTWSLELPDNVSLNISTGSGDMTISELNATVKTNSGSGDVEISNLKGNLDTNTGSGNITLEKVDGEISLNVGSGDIRTSQSSGTFSFNAGSGNIRLDQLKGEFSINVGSGDIRANAITINHESKFNSGSGNTQVSLATGLDHDISVNSGSGDATLAFNGNAISGEVIMSANKRSGNIIAPFKFDKEETIEEGNSSPVIRKTAKLGTKDITIKVSTGSGTAEISK